MGAIPRLYASNLAVNCRSFSLQLSQLLLFLLLKTSDCCLSFSVFAGMLLFCRLLLFLELLSSLVCRMGLIWLSIKYDDILKPLALLVEGASTDVDVPAVCRCAAFLHRWLTAGNDNCCLWCKVHRRHILEVAFTGSVAYDCLLSHVTCLQLVLCG